MHTYRQGIEEALTTTKVQLDKLHADIARKERLTRSHQKITKTLPISNGLLPNFSKAKQTFVISQRRLLGGPTNNTCSTYHRKPTMNKILAR
jgi:hypothetical protein